MPITNVKTCKRKWKKKKNEISISEKEDKEKEKENKRKIKNKIWKLQGKKYDGQIKRNISKYSEKKHFYIAGELYILSFNIDLGQVSNWNMKNWIVDKTDQDVYTPKLS